MYRNIMLISLIFYCTETYYFLSIYDVNSHYACEDLYKYWLSILFPNQNSRMVFYPKVRKPEIPLLLNICYSNQQLN